MCGIFGIWNRDHSPLKAGALKHGTDAIRHRGPDDEGYLLANSSNHSAVLYGEAETARALPLPQLPHCATTDDLGFGFRRLAILDTSPAGHQPMASRDQRFWMVFNGEVYNFLELRRELSGLGYHFDTGTDTEVILAAYDQWGPGCLSRFNGMWALAIWDRVEETLFLARDRMGVKPLFYVDTPETVAFASEVKALIMSGVVAFVPDDRQVYRYVVGGGLPSPEKGETFFQGVKSLPPGYSALVTRTSTQLHQYWRLNTDVDPANALSAKDAVNGYRELFVDAVRLRLRSDVSIGTCLSGGLDSTSIVCTVSRLMDEGGVNRDMLGERQKTFSAVYDSPGHYNEKPFVDVALATTGADGHFTYPTFERLLADLDRMVWHQDEPFQSTSIFAQWCVMSAVREAGVTVLLDGQGADEALAGYRPFGQFMGDIVAAGHLKQAIRESRAIRRITGQSMFLPLLKAGIHQLPPEVIVALRRFRWRKQTPGAALQYDFAGFGRDSDALSFLPAAHHGSLQDHLAAAIESTSLPHLLRHEDRNSMAFGVEARVPFVDYRLIEYSFQQASAWRIHEGWTKWVLREAMRGDVPDEIVWRRDKVGFETPEAAWTDALAARRDEFFGPDSLSGTYFDLSQVRNLLADWRSTGLDVRQVWRWFNLELWLRTWARRTALATTSGSLSPSYQK